MHRFDTYCNLILEAFYGKRVDIPFDGRPASDRYNNPGGAYPSQKFTKYGMEGYGIIEGGHPIAKYPTLAHGIAANIAHLKSMPIVGKTVGQARNYWVYGNFRGSKNLSGMDSNQVITQELLNDPNWLAQWMNATAKDEGFGKKGRKIDDQSFMQAMNILQKGGDSNFTPTQQYAGSDKGSSQPPSKVVSVASKAAAKSGAQPPSTFNQEDMNAKITKIANDNTKTKEDKKKEIDELLDQEEDSPLVASIKGNIDQLLNNIAMGGKIDTSALIKAGQTLAKKGLGLFNVG
jgi:hypothetical protein